ncbi:Cyclic nucleotide-binding-like [Parasponia andersonii]|uniref:Cyclic nucleotide-binding-like n=1 Tax=Parasponia andersonii TaxID=3476 RepID=A0A2P5BMY5_PARAD|nr:Cyclic nucleotide-binding-like [Parasponia andersonii]
MYFQMATARSEDIQQRMRTLEPEIDVWIREHGFPANEKTLMMEKVRLALEYDKESFDLKELQSLLMHRIERTKGNVSDDAVEKLTYGLRFDRAQMGNMIKEQRAERWMSRNGIPDDMKLEIMPYVRSKLQDNGSVDLKTMLSILPLQLRISVKKHLCLDVLKRGRQLHPLNRLLAATDRRIIPDYVDYSDKHGRYSTK